jgi:hypothetical protein
MFIVAIAIGLLMAIFATRTLGLAAFEARTSVAKGEPRQAKLRLAFALAVIVGCMISTIGILTDEPIIRALGVIVFLASVPILVAQTVNARTEFRKKTKS